MNTVLIFAGGTGVRMNSRGKPKQFLELHGKPIIIYTLEVFERHNEIDNIVVVCIENYIDELKKQIRKYEIKKVSTIVPGGDSGFESIYNGLKAIDANSTEDDIVLIHDGVRPLVNEQQITDNLACAKKYGNAISSVPVNEGIMISEDGFLVDDFPDRKFMFATKAPQTFKFRVIYDLYKRAKDEGFTSIESAHLCNYYGIKLHMVRGSYDNIKISTPTDYYIFRAIYDAIENTQIIGY